MSQWSPSSRNGVRRSTRLCGWECLEDRTAPAAGTLDAAFGSGGIAILDIIPQNFVDTDAAIQADGKIVAVGYLDADLGLLRLNPDGSLDESFGDGGMVETDTGRESRFNSVILQPDGKILAAGQGDGEAIIARYHDDGTLDASFGAGGFVRTKYSPTVLVGQATDLALQPDGKIVVVGSVGLNQAGDTQLAMMRLLPNGDLDPDFGDDGVVVRGGYSERYVAAGGVALLENGQIVMVGELEVVNIATRNSLIARFHADGSPDTTFGTEPTLGRTVVNTSDGGTDGFTEVYLLEGAILAAGHISHASTTLVRFNDPTLVVVNESSTAVASGVFADFAGLGAPIVSITSSIGGVSLNTQAQTWTWSFLTIDGPDQTQSVTLTATDSNGAESSIALDLVVNDVAPSVAVTGGATVTVSEGSPATNTGTFADPGADVVTVTASAGVISQSGAQSGTWSWSLAAADGPEQSQTITITATDSDGAASSVTFNLTVNNIAVPDLRLVQKAKPRSAPRGAKVTFVITLVNLGESFASGVYVTFQLPAGLFRVAKGSTPGWTAAGKRRFHLNVGDLGVGHSIQIVFKAKIAGAARLNAYLTTTATAGMDVLNGPDANPFNNRHKVRVRVI